MLRSPDYFDAFFGTLPQARALYEEHAELLRANKELAEKNMALKARHEGLRAETQTAFDEAKALQKRWHEQILPTQASAYKVSKARRRFVCNRDLAMHLHAGEPVLD